MLSAHVHPPPPTYNLTPMDPIYLDNNATTSLAPEALHAMLPYLSHFYGNASSSHRLGQLSRQAIDNAKDQVAALIGSSPTELTFTSGGTEAINTALRSLLASRSPRRKIVTSSVEHAATRELCRHLALNGHPIIEIPVNHLGALDLQKLADSIDDSVALVSIMWANNETGVIFPIQQIASICRDKAVPFHCDGTQAVGKIPVNVRDAGLDLMSLAAHKFHGPKGAGALFARRGIRLHPLIIGGPQQLGRRGGTENVPGIVGMGAAAQLAAQTLPLMPSVVKLRDSLENAILAQIPNSHLIGDPRNRLPNTTNIAFASLQADAILLLLSEQGICASAGAACSSGSLEPSHVLRAMNIDECIAHGAIRFSLSRYTTSDEIAHTLHVLPPLIHKLRSVLPVP